MVYVFFAPFSAVTVTVTLVVPLGVRSGLSTETLAPLSAAAAETFSFDTSKGTSAVYSFVPAENAGEITALLTVRLARLLSADSGPATILEYVTVPILASALPSDAVTPV